MVKVFKNEAGKMKVLSSYDRILDMWPVDFQAHHITSKYGTTHCMSSGSRENPPLLLFHGVGDNSAVMWALNIEELSRHFYCITVDTIGGPGKSIPNENYKKDSFNQVEWIDQIIEHFNIENFNIASVSNGAYMAYNYATLNSERINKVVCMEGGMITKPFKTMIKTLLIMFPEIVIPTEQNLLKIINKLSSPHSDLYHKHPLLVNHLVLLMKNHNQQAMFVHKLEKYNSETDDFVRDKLYFLMGEHKINLMKDLITILENGRFRYKVIPNAGHGINHEQPAVINNEIIQFLIA